MRKEGLVDNNESDATSTLLARILEGLPFGTLVVDGDMLLKASNSEAARLLEVSPADLAPGRAIAALIGRLVDRGDYGIGDADVTTAYVLAQLSSAGGKFTQKTPSLRVLGLSSRAINGDRMVTIEDLTDADAERANLRQSAHELRALLDSSPVAVAIVGSGGELLYSNQRHDELYGARADQLPKN